MITPPSLKKGDTIGVCAPSSRISPEDLAAAKSFLEERGYTVVIHPQCYNTKPALPDGTFTQYAGTVKEKADALHDLVRDPAINAIFFATGGTRALSILDSLDFDLIAVHPKIFLGFSDHTALLNIITARTGLITYHGPTMRRIPKNPQMDLNLRILSGEETIIPLSGAKILKPGKAEGRLIGGNLTLFRSLPDRDRPNPDGAILFLEEIKEELTTVDRDLCILKRAGILNAVSAILFGQFTDMADTGTPFGMTLDDIIAEHTQGLNIPILTNAPFGHDMDLPVFPIGQTVKLDSKALTFIL